MSRKLLFLMCVFFLSGCSTSSKESLEFDRVHIENFDSSKGTLLFFRATTTPLTFDMKVSVNNKAIVSLPNEAFSWVQLDPGVATLKVDWSVWSGMPSNEIKVEITKNQFTYLRLDSSLLSLLKASRSNTYNRQISAHIYTLIKKLNVAEAEKQIQECCRYVPSVQP